MSIGRHGRLINIFSDSYMCTDGGI